MRNGYFYLILAIIFASSPLAFAGTNLSQSQASELARHTLAKQASLPIKNLTVDSAGPVQWPDSSLGCPQPGMNYMQMITPGYRVTILDTASGKTHSVHVGSGHAIVCDKAASTRSQAEKNLRFGQRWQQSQKAQQLLANRLSVKQNEIRIVGVRQVQTNKVDPRCTKGPTSQKTQLIELSYDKKTYRYRALDDQLIACN